MLSAGLGLQLCPGLIYAGPAAAYRSVSGTKSTGRIPGPNATRGRFLRDIPSRHR